MARRGSFTEGNGLPDHGAGQASGGTTGERAKSRDLGVLLDLKRYLTPYRWHVVGATIALCLSASAVVGIGRGLQFLVDRGFARSDHGHDLLNLAVLILLAVVVLLAAATYARFYLVSWIGERVVADIRRDVFEHALKLSPGFYDTVRTAEIVSRLTTDTSIVQLVIGSSVSVALRNALMLVAGLVMLVLTSAKLTGLVVAVVPIVLVPILTYGRKVRRLSRASQDKVAEVGTRVDETLANIRTVQAFTHERHDRLTFRAQLDETVRVSVDRIRARALLTAIVMLLVFGAVSIILWIGGHDVLSGDLTAGDLAGFVFFAALVAGSVGAISEVVGDLQRAAGAMERIRELLATEPIVAPPKQPRALPTRVLGAVAFDAVRFAYPTRPERFVLEDFSFAIAPGERVALVGPSGSGKTTILQLLLRFYDPASGRVALDGVDLRDLPPDTLRVHMGLVSQDPVIFADSVLENVRYGRPDASEAEVRAALDAAYASDFVERLPDRLQTYLGERGVRLSGGQRQRIAIARAILRDPAVLLLDEATSALDAESENAVQRALERLMRNRTTLVIAHRLATVVSADRIVVLDAGRIVAEGTHTVLMRENGLYARLAKLQFQTTERNASDLSSGGLRIGVAAD